MISSTSQSAWIKYRTPNPQAQLRLFCFPYAGGSAAIFRDWNLELPTTLEVCPIELPGRGSRMKEPRLTEMPSLLEALGKALRPYLDQPYALFGHSLGALISFEFACHCRRWYNRQPNYLFVSGRQAPHIPDPSPLHGVIAGLLSPGAIRKIETLKQRKFVAQQP